MSVCLSAKNAGSGRGSGSRSRSGSGSGPGVENVLSLCNTYYSLDAYIYIYIYECHSYCVNITS